MGDKYVPSACGQKMGTRKNNDALENEEISSTNTLCLHFIMF